MVDASWYLTFYSQLFSDVIFTFKMIQLLNILAMHFKYSAACFSLQPMFKSVTMPKVNLMT